ncbi:MAG TPA: TlpA disulfide reductase family protein [Tepidisphaeraceae bacterium]|jgi:thiol-disulfide isomerase/thioredoxin
MTRRIVTFLVLIVAFATIARLTFFHPQGPEWEFPRGWFWHDDESQRAHHAELLGKPAPPLDLSDWRNGEVQPQDMKGKVVVLDFWATWCGPCIAAIPHNNELAEKWKDKGVLIVGVCTANGQENFDKIVSEKGIKYPVARDPNVKSGDAWRVMWYPTYAVVDRKGVLRAIGLKPEFVERVVEKLVAEGAQTDSGPAAAAGQ